MMLLAAIESELLKLRNSPIVKTSFFTFALAPVMGGVFIIVLNDPALMDEANPLAMKAKAMNFKAAWNSYFGLLLQAVAVGGILMFGFVASWIFGREYSDGTAKDLLSLPVSRSTILNAKFIIYSSWCIVLSLSNLVIGFLIGTVLDLPVIAATEISAILKDYFTTTFMVLLLGTPIAFFALWGKGYMAPLGFVAVTLVFAQVIAATGYGTYFPWSVPGLYSGAGGSFKDFLNIYSYLLLLFTALAGYMATITYWKYADQSK